MTGSGESSGTSSRNASALPSTVSQPSVASRSSVSAGWVPPCTTSPRQTTSSTPRRSTSSSAAWNATSLPCWSERSARRTARGYPASRVVPVLRRILVRRRAGGARRGSGRLSGDRLLAAVQSGHCLDVPAHARGDVHARGRLHVARADRARRRDGAEARREGLLARPGALEQLPDRARGAHEPRHPGRRRRDQRGDRRRLLRQWHRRTERNAACRTACSKVRRPSGARASASAPTAPSRRVRSPRPGSGRETASAGRCSSTCRPASSRSSRPAYGTATPKESGAVVEAVIGTLPPRISTQPLDGTVTQVTTAGSTPIPRGGAVLVARARNRRPPSSRRRRRSGSRSRLSCRSRRTGAASRARSAAGRCS